MRRLPEILLITSSPSNPGVDNVAPEQVGRRTFLRAAWPVGLSGAAIAAGMLKPRWVMAAWPETAFNTQNAADALARVAGNSTATPSQRIQIKGPEQAADGRFVSVSVHTDLPSPEQIVVLVAENRIPLVADYRLGINVQGYVSMRLKMARTSDVIAVVKSQGKLFESRQRIRIPEGQGCAA